MYSNVIHSVKRSRVNLNDLMKPKHIFRSVSLFTGVFLVICAIVDGWNNWLPHLDSQWLLAAGIVLIALAARKAFMDLPKQ